MTVAELIEQLQKYPGETKVVYSSGDMGLSEDVTSADIGLEYSIFGYGSKQEVTIHWEVENE